MVSMGGVFGTGEAKPSAPFGVGAAAAGGVVVEFESVDFGVVAGVAAGDAATNVGLVSDAAAPAD